MLLRYNSHRARERLTTLAGRDLPEYFAWTRSTRYLDVPAGLVERALMVKGVSKPRTQPTDVRRALRMTGTQIPDLDPTERRSEND